MTKSVCGRGFLATRQPRGAAAPSLLSARLWFFMQREIVWRCSCTLRVALDLTSLSLWLSLCRTTPHPQDRQGSGQREIGKAEGDLHPVDVGFSASEGHFLAVVPVLAPDSGRDPLPSGARPGFVAFSRGFPLPLFLPLGEIGWEEPPYNLFGDLRRRLPLTHGDAMATAGGDIAVVLGVHRPLATHPDAAPWPTLAEMHSGGNR